VTDLFNPTPEHRALRELVRSFTEREVDPQAEASDREERFNAELFAKLGELGLLGITVEERFGGAGLDPVAAVIAHEELSSADPGFTLAYLAHSMLFANNLQINGSDEQRSKYLPDACTGRKVCGMCMTEPGAGTDVLGMQTTAVRKGDVYVLNGAKMWITNGSSAEISVVWAKLEGEVHGFLVERDREGFEARLMKHKLSMRASDTSELILSDCRIPKANRLPTTGGIRYPLSCLKQARYGIAWGVLGAAMACFHEAVEYSKDRIQFGKPIGAFQLTQKKLADMATEISLAQLLCLQLGRLKDDGIADFVQVSLAKRNNVRKAMEIALEARTILGANGISGEYQCMRHAANLESVDTYEGTYEIHTLILGNRLTGIEAYE